MAKKFGRNQKRKLKLALEQYKEASDAALLAANTQEQRLRNDLHRAQARKQHQVVIDLAIDRDPMSMEAAVHVGAYSTDYRHEPIKSVYRFDPHNIKYTLSRDAQQEYVCDLATMIAKMIERDVFGAMRDGWNVGYGRDVEPYERYPRGRY